jgi:hypothetical protein
MGVAGVGATCWYQRRTHSKCGVELVSEQVPELIMAPVWPAAGRSSTPVSSLHAIGRSASHGFLSYFSSFAGCCANHFEDNHLANGCPVRAASSLKVCKSRARSRADQGGFRWLIVCCRLCGRLPLAAHDLLCVTSSGHRLHASAFKRTLAWASIAQGPPHP